MLKFLKNKAIHFLKDDLIRHTAIVFAGTAIGGIFNLIYHLVSVRLLTPENYGTFNALISLVMFTSITVSPLAPTLTRFFTEYIVKEDFATLISVFKKLIKRLLILSFFFFFVFVVFSQNIAGFFKTEPVYIIVCGGIVALSLFSLLFLPVFQSFQKFKTFSAIGVLSSFTKLIVGAVFMFLGWQVLGSLSGFLAAPVIVFFISLFFISYLYRSRLSNVNLKSLHPVNLRPIYKYCLPVGIALFSFTLLTNIDVVLVKHLFPEAEAGFYSIAQLVGKLFLFAPSALAIVMFPKSTAAYIKNSSSHKLLYKSLMLAGAICGVGIIICFLYPGVVLSVITSQPNPVSRELIGLFSLSMSFYALAWILIYYLLSIHRLKFVYPLLVFAILQATAIYTFHPSLKMILYIVLSFGVVSFLTLLFVALNIKSEKME
jgi:O-antigen/teichoic acid export membrane protein